MNKYVNPPTMDQMLKDYMKPLHLSAYKLAKLINVPTSRIQDILHDRRKMSIDTSMRLGKLFDIDGLFFFRVQLDLDYRLAKYEMNIELEKIKTLEAKTKKIKKQTKGLQNELDKISPIQDIG